MPIEVSYQSLWITYISNESIFFMWACQLALRPWSKHSLNDLDEAAGRCSVQRTPALVVSSVDVTPALHQKLHHLGVFVDAGLQEGTRPHDGERLLCVYFKKAHGTQRQSQWTAQAVRVASVWLVVKGKTPKKRRDWNNDYCVYSL